MIIEKKNQGRRKRVSERGRERIIKEGEGNERKANKRQLAMERDITAKLRNRH